ncbi:hypothetical protein FPZ43_18040 [Mucilaginibacter pallidiroseus]|uniref:Uncharacterized protein n=1 Tax=Mucilaginibacter pallidiroseus TaxID=2599295 RepID=A0A563TZK8_9SPHI|nr:hypothetical protein [Mucilaginibacter pallidiroseus]TWR24797.1 hypothetical protein FPZ43_18040 [Mucilaginibacter pallidiroseus]
MMKYKDLDPQKYPKLLEDAVKKLTLTLERDSKVLTEMNNSLNWIVTLLGVILATGISYFKNVSPCSLSFTLLYASRIGFCFAVLSLIIHKIFLVRYETAKFQYLNSLNTHELELKYDQRLLSKNIIQDSNFFIVEFINNFRNGQYIPHPEIDNRAKEFLKLDKTIISCARILKFTFWLSMIIFILNAAAVFYLILA